MRGLILRASPGWLLRGAPAAEPAAAAASALAAAGLSVPPASLWDSGEWWMLLAAQSMAVGTVRAPRAAALLTGSPRMPGWHCLCAFLALSAAPCPAQAPVTTLRRQGLLCGRLACGTVAHGRASGSACDARIQGITLGSARMCADERPRAASMAGALVKPSGMGLRCGWGRRSGGAGGGALVTWCVGNITGLAGHWLGRFTGEALGCKVAFRLMFLLSPGVARRR